MKFLKSKHVPSWKQAILIFNIQFQLSQEQSLFLPHSRESNLFFSTLTKMLDPYDIPPGGKNSNNFWTKHISVVTNERITHYKDMLIPEVPLPGPIMDKYSRVDSKVANIPIQTMIDIEQQSRRALLAVSAVDTLTGGVRHLNNKESLSETYIETREAMCRSLVRAMAHAGTFLSNSIAMSMLARRKAYLTKPRKLSTRSS